MSEKVERKILGLIKDGRESPYGNPIPGLGELGLDVSGEFLTGLVALTDAAGVSPVTVTIRRIGEPVQVDPESLGLLTSAGLTPGQRVSIVRTNGRVVVSPEGSDHSAGVSLPDEVAVHVFAQLGPVLVLAPSVFWLYWSGSTGAAIALLIWSVPVAALDNVVRPILIRRGVQLPLLLIIAGVIGGLISFGVVGLFIGPVILAATYTLAKDWVAEG